jgi:hypothetical protein
MKEKICEILLLWNARPANDVITQPQKIKRNKVDGLSIKSFARGAINEHHIKRPSNIGSF